MLCACGAVIGLVSDDGVRFEAAGLDSGAPFESRDDDTRGQELDAAVDGAALPDRGGIETGVADSIGGDTGTTGTKEGGSVGDESSLPSEAGSAGLTVSVTPWAALSAGQPTPVQWASSPRKGDLLLVYLVVDQVTSATLPTVDAPYSEFTSGVFEASCGSGSVAVQLWSTTAVGTAVDEPTVTVREGNLQVLLVDVTEPSGTASIGDVASLDPAFAACMATTGSAGQPVFPTGRLNAQPASAVISVFGFDGIDQSAQPSPSSPPWTTVPSTNSNSSDPAAFAAYATVAGAYSQDLVWILTTQWPGATDWGAITLNVTP